MRLAIALVGAFFILGANAMAAVNQATLAKDAEELEKKMSSRERNISLLREEAEKEGISGMELAALMGQAAHESGNFSTLREWGRGKGKKYDGGGTTYYGRGVFQLTHKYNYKKYGKIPEIKEYLDSKYGSNFKLENNPDTVATDPVLSAKVAVAYWKKAVRPAVKKYADGNFGDTQVISAAINRPAGNTLDPKRQVKKTNKAIAEHEKNKSLASMKAVDDAYLQKGKVKGLEDRSNKTREWAERLGVDTSEEFSKPMFQKEQYQEQLKNKMVPSDLPPAPPSTAPAEQTGASLSPEEEEDESKLKRLKQLYV
jgi:predicted chitinase